MIVTKACTYLCSIPTGGSGGSGGGGTPNPDPDVNCNDPKCSYCKKCVNPTRYNCSKCDCQEHIHEECPWCYKCYKDDDDVCKTRSTVHTESCPTCKCCPDCNGLCIEPWIGVGHANIINEAFIGFTSAQSEYLNEGSRDVDTKQDPEYSYMHGMRERGQSKEEQ